MPLIYSSFSSLIATSPLIALQASTTNNPLQVSVWSFRVVLLPVVRVIPTRVQQVMSPAERCRICADLLRAAACKLPSSPGFFLPL